MRETATTRGLELTSLSRPLRPEDLSNFDYILGMDFENMAGIQVAADDWADRSSVPADYRNKVPCFLVPLTCAFCARAHVLQIEASPSVNTDICRPLHTICLCIPDHQPADGNLPASAGEAHVQLPARRVHVQKYHGGARPIL